MAISLSPAAVTEKFRSSAHPLSRPGERPADAKGAPPAKAAKGAPPAKAAKGAPPAKAAKGAPPAKGAKGARGTWPMGKKTTAPTDESHAQTKPAKAAKGAKEVIDSTPSHQVPLDAEGWPDHENRHLDRSMSLGDLAGIEVPEPEYLINGLIRKGSAVIALTDTEVDYFHYLLALAIAAGAGHEMRPYGPNRQIKVCVLYSGEMPATDIQYAQLIREQFNNPENRERADANVIIKSMAEFETRRRSLAIGSDQRRLVDLVPGDAELVIILDANLPRPKGVDENELRSLDGMLRELIDSGKSVLLCSHVERRFWANMRRTIRTRCPLSFIQFEYDQSAPVDNGTGFIINRPRFSIHENGPLRYRVWLNKDGRKLTFGFGLIDPDDTQSARATRAAEFKKMCMVLEAQEIPRNQIAESLGVHKSTVTRALGPVRGKKKSKCGDDTDTGSEASE